MMKSLVITAGAMFTLFACAPAPAFDNLSGALNYKNISYDDVDSNAYEVRLGTRVHEQAYIDVRSEFQDFEGDLGTLNMIEAGVVYSYPVMKTLDFTARGALGYTNQVDFGYYSIEPGLVYAATDDFDLKISYRFRDSFDRDFQVRSNSVLVGGEYSINKNWGIALGYEGSFDEVESDALVAGLTFNF